MKIGPLENKSTLAPASADRKPANGVAAAASTTSTEPSAKVELSAAASVIANGSFDAQKVERLARAIRDGQYQIDAQAIADQLLAHTRELLDSGKQ